MTISDNSSLYNPKKIMLSETWVVTVLSTMVMGSKVTCRRPMFTYLISMNRETQQYTNPTYIMRLRVAGLRPISISTIINNKLYKIVKRRVYFILRP